MDGMRYEAPETLQAAVELLAGAKGVARVLAGGTDVIVQMETDLIEPELLVDIKKIAETRQFAAENGGFHIGAAVPGMAIVNNAAFCKAWPGVVDGVHFGFARLVLRICGLSTFVGASVEGKPGS